MFNLTHHRQIQSVERKRKLMMHEARNWKRQDVQAAKMKRRNKEAININVGDVVVFLIIKQQRARASELHIPAVVFEVSKGGSARLVCEHGVLHESKTEFFPPDRWGKKERDLPLNPSLNAYREMIRGGNFEHSVFQRITPSGAHQKMNPDSSMGVNRCLCKNMCK